MKARNVRADKDQSASLLNDHVTPDTLTRALQELSVEQQFDSSGQMAGISVFASKVNR